MLEIAICDDNLQLSGDLETLLLEMEKSCGVGFDIDIFQDGSDLVRDIRGGRRFDIICLDIQMNRMNGVEAAHLIREIDKVVKLIYVTSYDSYMKEVFAVSPSGFIVKPLKREEFQKTFYRIMKEILAQDEYYRFRYCKENYKLQIKDIVYFESERRKTIIVSTRGNYQEYKKLTDIEAELDKGKGLFLRVHKSFLINYWHAVNFSKDQVVMDNGISVPAGRVYKASVDEKMKKLLSILPR